MAAHEASQRDSARLTVTPRRPRAGLAGPPGQFAFFQALHGCLLLFRRGLPKAAVGKEKPFGYSGSQITAFAISAQKVSPWLT
jgi:hypothetical protein